MTGIAGDWKSNMTSNMTEKGMDLTFVTPGIGFCVTLRFSSYRNNSEFHKFHIFKKGGSVYGWNT